MTAPRAASALLARGVTAAEHGRVAEGIAQIREAIVADPHNAEALAQLGRWLSQTHHHAEALEAIERALALAPKLAVTVDTIGVVFARAGRHERACECFERAVVLDPARADVRFNLASTLKFLGRFDAARAAYEACLTVDPRHARAHWALAQLVRATPVDNRIERLEKLLAAGSLDARDELLVRHALARELEDLGRLEESFAHLAAGKARQRAALRYDVAADLRLFEATMQTFPARSDLPVRDVHLGKEAIFVVGLPRTGTTVVERILTSHVDVASVGESPNFGVLLKRATGSRSQRVLDEATILRSDQVDFDALGREYLASTRPVAAAKLRFVDKTPLNFFYLGHIARALPAARLVVLRRDPRDTGLSLFRQLFATRFSYYGFALDLRDIARYYAAFDRLVAHWADVLPGQVLEVQYEALVKAPVAESRRLFAYCGLAWDPAVIEFERNPAPVATASAVQVRQPLNAASVGRWRRYESQLAPLVETLAGLGVRLPGSLESRS
jgi:tetratricopeptide (TPR) repeat protein